jgi:hypothetical protein
MFLIKKYIVPGLWNSWDYIREENFDKLTYDEKAYINSMDFRDEFKNYPELFPGDPFTLIETQENFFESLAKAKKQAEREIDYEMSKSNILVDLVKKKDEYMYNYLMSTLKKSMLHYDPT